VTTQHLIDAVAQANQFFGPDQFNVLTIGFDARNDTPARMAHFASIQGIKAPNWQVASADPATITAILRDLGFSYASVAGGFDHITQTTVLERGGKVYRHVYGDEFPIRMFMEPMRDVVYGRSAPLTVSGIVDRIKFICTTFDPGAGRYKIDYGLVFGSVIAAISLLIFGLLILREWRKTSRHA
jgi:protein SCO1/2